ncbi:unnamed protein product [Haemonchus placei]|uniref:SERTA domain-containing protein n=1 Tax=Haemonchus placei TaxID=6290 RepID=A0A158QRN0_HAEPC|nr:unnamed protein product [Haemonchus placei]
MSVSLVQSVRIRERIYQVKKQCRRLEAMKRVALHVLHRSTGTHEIPPLEIVDEDPAPSFLESVRKQQQSSPETLRKKSKRPSRCKADDKLTPEEEERAKQKICSIIDSVYSETAKRMGEKPKREMCSENARESLNQCHYRRLVSRRLSISHRKSEEEKKKNYCNIFGDQVANDGCQASGSPARSNERSDANVEENEMAISPTVSLGETNRNPSIKSTFNNLLLEHHLRPTVCEGRVNYSDTVEQAPICDKSLVSNNYGFLGAIQPLNYTGKLIAAFTSNISSTDLSMDCAPLQRKAEASAVHTIASTYANNASVIMSCNENLDRARMLYYPKEVTPSRFLTAPPTEFREGSDEASEKVEVSKSSVEFLGAMQTALVSKMVSLVPSDEERVSTVNWSSKQKPLLEQVSSGLPPPNYIPYRMIAVENVPVDVIAIGSSG